MPLYEYECASCQKVHEVMQKFSDDPLALCPDCNGPVSKLISMSSFALKGSGWYTTDYKRKPAASTPGATAKTGSESSAPAATSESSAPAASVAPAPSVSAPASAPAAAAK